MGHQNVCINCHIAFNSGYFLTKEIPCPNCGGMMIWMPHRFRPPKKADNEKWAAVKYLVEHGFKYHHIYENNTDSPKFPISVRYPQTS